MAEVSNSTPLRQLLLCGVLSTPTLAEMVLTSVISAPLSSEIKKGHNYHLPTRRSYIEMLVYTPLGEIAAGEVWGPFYVNPCCSNKISILSTPIAAFVLKLSLDNLSSPHGEAAFSSRLTTLAALGHDVFSNCSGGREKKEEINYPLFISSPLLPIGNVHNLSFLSLSTFSIGISLGAYYSSLIVSNIAERSRTRH